MSVREFLLEGVGGRWLTVSDTLRVLPVRDEGRAGAPRLELMFDDTLLANRPERDDGLAGGSTTGWLEESDNRFSDEWLR